MRRRLLVPLVLGILALTPAAAFAAGWSAVSLPRHASLTAVSCASPRMCLGVGTWGTRMLSAISCATPTFCAAIGHYAATNGALGPLAATWDGSAWTQVALRRGPVELGSVSCPTARWCMAVGDGIAERWSG